MNIFGVEVTTDLVSVVKVTIVYFAQAREAAGIREDEFHLQSPANTEHLFSEVLKAHPKIREIKDRLSVIVNGRHVSQNIELNDGDRIALVPPVGGG